MENINLNKKVVVAPVVESAEGRSPTRDSTTGAGQENFTPVSEQKPNPEVSPTIPRRTYSLSYKLKVLQETDASDGSGQIGAILRREGIYSSHLTKWRRQRAAGTLNGLTPKKRGKKSSHNGPEAAIILKLEKEKKQLQMQLKKAEKMVDIQKKVSEIFGMTLEMSTPVDKR